MLTREQTLVVYDDATGCAVPDRLTRRTHRRYAAYAQQLLAIYSQGIGTTRRELHQQVENALATVADCPRRRIAAFQKLLDEAADYDGDAGKQAARLRQRVFSLAARYHPLVTRAEGIYCHLAAEVKQRIATELQRSWEEIEAELFCDVIEFQRLKKFNGYASAAALLARYNVAQTQAALYRAEQLMVWADTDFKLVLRYAKLGGLMHSIRRESNGSYCFRFDGPASVLRRSTRYGVAMARFLPGLLACRQWRATAKILNRWGKRYRLELSSQDGLHSQAAVAEEFDSELEAQFVAAWHDGQCAGWSLHRETEILHAGQSVFTPDFVLTGPTGRRVLLEIVGYWTPEYLEHKTRQLEKFADQDILLAVPAQTQWTIPQGLPTPILFRGQLKPADVLARLEQIA